MLRKYYSVVHILGMLLLISHFGYGMELGFSNVEEHSDIQSIAVVASIKDNVGLFEGALDTLLQDCSSRRLEDGERGTIIQPADSIVQKFGDLKGRVQIEVEDRRKHCLPSQAHHQMQALFSLMRNRLNSDEKGVLAKELSGLQEEKMDPEDRELKVAEFYEEQLENIQTIEKFFSLAQDHPTAYRLCRNFYGPKLLAQLIKNSQLLDRIGEDCYTRWYGKDGFGRSFRQSIERELEVLEKALVAHYQAASDRYDELRKLYGRYKKKKFMAYKDDEVYRQNQKSIDKSIGELRSDISAEDKAWKNAYDSSATCWMHHELLVDKKKKGKGKEELASDDEGDDKQAIVSAGESIPRSVKVPQKISKAITGIFAKVPHIFAKMMRVTIALQCFDDFYSQLIAASGNPDFILSDLASRLRTDDAALDKKDAQKNKGARGPKTLIAAISDVLHSGLVLGRYAGHYAIEFPEDLDDACKTVDRLALTTRSIADIGTGKRTGNEGYFANWGKSIAGRFLKGQTGEEIFKAAFSVDGVGNKLKKYIVPVVNNLLSALKHDMTKHSSVIIKFDALTRMSKLYSMKDSRTRSLGDKETPFRQWFDQIGKTWENPEKEKASAFDSEHSTIQDSTSSSSEPNVKKEPESDDEDLTSLSDSYETSSEYTDSNSDYSDDD